MVRKTEGERDRQLYRFLEASRRRNGHFPSYREIAEALGWKSTNTVSRSIGRLVDQGLLEKDPGRARSYRLKRYRRSRYLARQAAELDLRRMGRGGGKTGRTIWLDSSWFSGRTIDAWEVSAGASGSWGLQKGDCLVADRDAPPRPGDFALADVGGRIVVGQVFFEDGSPRLLVRHEPEEVFTFGEGSLAVDLGTVVGLLRRFRP